MPLLQLALPSTGFLVCGLMLDLTAESRGIPFSPLFLHMIHNATQATAYRSFILATWCKESDMDVAVPEIFAHPSRETLSYNHT